MLSVLCFSCLLVFIIDPEIFLTNPDLNPRIRYKKLWILIRDGWQLIPDPDPTWTFCGQIETKSFVK
jgi:hypothetical protein